jgi:hypothetical protein
MGGPAGFTFTTSVHAAPGQVISAPSTRFMSRQTMRESEWSSSWKCTSAVAGMRRFASGEDSTTEAHTPFATSTETPA